MDKIHKQVLKKFEMLAGETLIGRQFIKGPSTGQLVPPDQYVDSEHILHDLIRGFYKPAKKPYLLSYQATESNENYGQQIRWKHKDNYSYELIEMHPPNSPKDNRKKSDINAARYNLNHKIPIGILLKERKGVNTVLGTGLITEERADGVFIVIPYKTALQNELLTEINSNDNSTELLTEIVKEIKRRKGQDKFRKKLTAIFPNCVLCDINNEHSIASHIKPWSESSNEERLDEYNGLILCPNHDYLFDKGLISFDLNGNVLISNQLSSKQLSEFRIDKGKKIHLNERTKKYMDYHQNFIFKDHDKV